MILDKKILSIDQRTSATKVLLLKADGQIVHRCTENHQHFYPQPDWEEHNPIEIWKNTYTAIRNILKEINIDVKHIAAMAITNQRETIVVWDRNTGQLVYNAVVWQCQRGAQMCMELHKQGYDAIVEDKKGLLIEPYFSAIGIKWILQCTRSPPKSRRSAAAGGGSNCF